MIYEITFDDRNGYAKCATRKRIDSAHDMAYKFAYEALDANGLRDRPIAHATMAKIAQTIDDMKRFKLPKMSRAIDMGYPGIITIHKESI